MFEKILVFIFLVSATLGTYGQEKENSEFNLMPWPQKIAVNPGNFKIDKDFQVLIKNGSDHSSRIYAASIRFLRYVTDKTGIFIDNGFPGTGSDETVKGAVMISFDSVARLENGMDESYEISVSTRGIEIKSPTDIGAMRALSTLLQLITVREGAYVIPNVLVMDAPRFPWRGLFMDVARHFMPVDVVKRNLDAMAFVKLNVFHWHLSDDQGFRVEVKSLPNLHEKASDGQYYTHEQIKDIVKYADERGIRVVPEFDVPGHGTAFLTAYPELASKKGVAYTLERYAGIFDPTIDPTIDMTYTFLDKLFKEVTPLFPDQYFHIGGDENEGKHWDENEDIQEFMKKNKLKDNHALQTYFNIKLEKILAKYNKSLVGWEEIMTENMPKSAMIQSWRGVNEGLEPGQSLVEAVKNGYQTILSNGYYIDLLLSVEDHYLVDPMPNVALTPEESKRILGGEATMWSELVTPLTIDSRIWPRTAAIAERFWSAQEVQNLDDMHRRLEVINNSLELIGLRHLQAKEYLLRNIANYQNVDALRELTNISEPFKIYSRNAGGTEYKSFSPFTLFADACTADARDARPFRSLVNQYVGSKDDSSKKELISYLNRWSEIGKNLALIEPNAPLVTRVLPYANRVGDIADLCLEALNNGTMSQEKSALLVELLKKKEDPKVNLDVELAVSRDLLKLGKFLEKK